MLVVLIYFPSFMQQVVELTEENARLKMRSPEGTQQLADVSDSGTSSQFTSRHTSSNNLAAAVAAVTTVAGSGTGPTGPVSSSSAAGSVAVSPLASPRTLSTPRVSAT
jgi:hypothetical protein